MNEKIREHIRRIDPKFADAYFHAIQILRIVDPPKNSNIECYDKALENNEYNWWTEEKFSTRAYVGLVSHLMGQEEKVPGVKNMMVDLFKVKTEDNEFLKNLTLEQGASVLALNCVMKRALSNYSWGILFPSADEENWKRVCLKESHAYEISDVIKGYFKKTPFETVPNNYLQLAMQGKLISS